MTAQSVKIKIPQTDIYREDLLVTTVKALSPDNLKARCRCIQQAQIIGNFRRTGSSHLNCKLVFISACCHYLN